MERHSEALRLEFILAGQQHADCYLTPLADPAGKTVLVLGAGAGTDVLWALRQGAREVVGIDVLEQDPSAFRAAASHFGLDAGRVSFQCLDLVGAARLGRRFDLVLSNNVFEHVADLPGAFAACAEVVEPGRGRVAIFSAPLFYSSGGSHLPHDPWEHLWGEPVALREKLLKSGRLPARHALEDLDLSEYLDREICLNRAHLTDYLDAIRQSGLAFLHLSLLPDTNLSQLPLYLEKIRSKAAVDVADLTVAGFAVELVLPPEGAEVVDLSEVRPAAQARLDEERRRHGEDMAGADAVIAEERKESAALRERIADLKQGLATLNALIASVEASWSHRIGRAITAPARWLRPRSRAGGE
ncbi:MAG TPA: class I SAM-dependent methyltransferase [Thermoanaerobaculia bacterium]|nr:class I SAM-dependent methyltransferase [Thermoanaerobaculia bacterium]